MNPPQRLAERMAAHRWEGKGGVAFPVLRYQWIRVAGGRMRVRHPGADGKAFGWMDRFFRMVVGRSSDGGDGSSRDRRKGRVKSRVENGVVSEVTDYGAGLLSQVYYRVREE